MFTGIVEALGTVRAVTPEGAGCRLVIAGCAGDRLGDSIAVNGVCLTVVACEADSLAFQVGPETLARTNLSRLMAGDRVNLERALLPTTRLSGHFVQGHVDGTARIARRTPEADYVWMDFETAPDLTRTMVPKGSVAVDGISLTLVAVDSGAFRIMLIPHTLAQTTLGWKDVGDIVNIEVDLLGKYVFHAIQAMRSSV